MKKFFYLMILALVPMCFVACGSDDDDSGINAIIEGNWRVQSVKWSHYIKGGSIEQEGEVEEYDETTTKGLSITKVDGKYKIISTTSGIKGNFEQVGPNEFKSSSSGDDVEYHRLSIVGVSGNILTVEFYEDYYENSDGKRDEYGLFTFVRQ